jgi:hypothetical protein
VFTAEGHIYVWGGFDHTIKPTQPILEGVADVRFTHLSLTNSYCIAISSNSDLSQEQKWIL